MNKIYDCDYCEKPITGSAVWTSGSFDQPMVFCNSSCLSKASSCIDRNCDCCSRNHEVWAPGEVHMLARSGKGTR